MLGRPTLCRGGAGPGFRRDFPTSCPLPDDSGVPVRPVASPLPCQRQGQYYFGFVHGAEVLLMEWSGRGDPSFPVRVKGSNPPSEISPLLGILSKMRRPCVFKIKCRKTDGKKIGGRFFEVMTQTSRLLTLLRHENPWRSRW